jgi:hypothetical protein
MVSDLWIDQLGAECPEAAERPFLFGFDQARVTGNIGRDRRELALRAPWRLLGGGRSTPARARRALSMTAHAAPLPLLFDR